MSGHITLLGHQPEHYTRLYVDVEDVQAALDEASALGGWTLVRPITLPAGRLAWLADPDANAIERLKPAKPQGAVWAAGLGEARSGRGLAESVGSMRV